MLHENIERKKLNEKVARSNVKLYEAMYFEDINNDNAIFRLNVVKFFKGFCMFLLQLMKFCLFSYVSV